MVVAIIGILGSILLPSLGKARADTKKAVCKSNLKQIIFATIMYSDSYNDYFPSRNPTTKITYDDLLSGFDGRTTLSLLDMQLNGLSAGDTGGSSRVYECPSSPFSFGPKRSYAINLWGNNQTKFRGISGNAPAPKSRTMSQINYSDEVIAYGETGGDAVKYTMGRTGGDITSAHHMNNELFIQLRYNGGEYHRNVSNYLFVDGHVESRRYFGTLVILSGGMTTKDDVEGTIWDADR